MEPAPVVVRVAPATNEPVPDAKAPVPAPPKALEKSPPSPDSAGFLNKLRKFFYG